MAQKPTVLHVSKPKGFTLIEVMAVVAIIGVLATIAVLNFTDAKARSRDGKRIADVETLKDAVGLYKIDKKIYPDCGGAGCTSASADITESNMPALSPYLGNSLPRDPKTGNGYRYVRGPSPFTSYGILAGFEIDNTQSCHIDSTLSMIGGGCVCKTGDNMNALWYNGAPTCSR